MNGSYLRRLGYGLTVLFATLGLLLTIITFTPVVKWWARLLSDGWNDPKGDVLIVLGGDMIDRTTLGYGSTGVPSTPTARTRAKNSAQY